MNEQEQFETWFANDTKGLDKASARAGWVERMAREQAATVPDVLFDGFAVYSALDEKAKARTSPENVSDTLDAVVRVLRAALAKGEGKETQA